MATRPNRKIHKVAEILVVIARNIDELRALAGLAEELLDDVVVKLVPIPGLAQRPVVDEVTDDIELVRLGRLEKVEQLLGLRPSCSEMDVGNENRTIACGRSLSGSGSTA